MAKSKPRVLFLAICSGDPQVILRGAAAGRLPNLKALLDQSLVGKALALPGVYVGAHWPSFISGCHPGNNGIHSWEQLRPGTYEMYRCQAATYAQRPPFWDALSAAGRRLCLLDIPHSRVSPTINGLQLVEWGAHDAGYGFRASSPALRDEVLRLFGRHPVSGESDADRNPEALLAFRDELLDGVRRKTRLTQHYLQQGDWELFAQVFTEAHCAGHLCWHTHDPLHPRHQEFAGTCGDLLMDVYEAIDAGIGQILETVDRDTPLIFLANHGMGPKYSAQHLLDSLLLGLGVAAPLVTPPRPPSLRERLDPLLTRAWQTLPAAAKSLLQPLRRDAVAWVTAERRPPQRIDRAASLCFPVQNNTASGALRVNLEGREPAGRVAPGKPYEELLDRLTDEFLAMRNPANGEPIVRAIYRSDEHYPGAARAHLPDLLLEWSHAAPVNAVSSPSVGTVEGTYSYCRTGDHRPEGLYAMRAPWLAADSEGPAVNCTDFAPTFGALLDVPMPGMDGQAIAELLPARASAAC